MDISIIIPTFNSGAKLHRCVDALTRQKTERSYEIIVVDDGSTDTSLEKIQIQEIKVYRQSNQGPAAARNLGVGKAKGKIILFTDADCEPTGDWIEQMVLPFEDPDISGVKGSYLTRQKKIVARFVQLEYENKYEKMKKEGYIDFIDTYSAGFIKRDFCKTGQYNTRFPSASVEDQEFSFRMWKKGYRMVFNPQARVYHTHVDALFSYMKKKFRIGFWKFLVLKQHPGKIVRDSHTPQSLKFEMVFSLLFFIFLSLSLLNDNFLFLAVLSLSGFFLVISPFIIKALRKDPVVGICSPFLLFSRAVSLSAGLIAGSVKFSLQQGKIQKRDQHGII